MWTSRCPSIVLLKSPQTINAGEGVEKRESSYTAGGNVNWYKHYGEQHRDSLKIRDKTTISSVTQSCLSLQPDGLQHTRLPCPYDPAIPPPYICPEETKTEKDICTPMFTVALFIIKRIWKQPKCSLTDECIKKLWYLHTMDYYSAIKRNAFGQF